MKAFSSVLILGLLAGTAACNGAQTAGTNNAAEANSLTTTSEGTAAPIANDSETANSATGKPVGGDAADPAAVEGASAGEGPGDKPAGDAAAAAAATDGPKVETAPPADKPQ